MIRSGLIPGVLLWVVMMLSGTASAGREAEDLKRQIDTQRAGVNDLERLDEKHAVPDELTLYRSWLDEASTQLTAKEWDRVREVLDRCVAQAELIRQKISATRATAQMQAKEDATKRSKEKVAQTKAYIQQALVNKKALEMNVK